MCFLRLRIRGGHTTLPPLELRRTRENDSASRVDLREMAGGAWWSRRGLQPRATMRVKDVRELRAMIQVRSVARRVLTSAECDLADRTETLHCGFLVLHANRLPEMVNAWLCASGPANHDRTAERSDAICVP